MSDVASPLLTDLYQLNMIKAYLDHGETQTAVFEFFVWKLPCSVARPVICASRRKTTGRCWAQVWYQCAPDLGKLGNPVYGVAGAGAPQQETYDG